MAVDATAMAGRSLRFDAAENARPRGVPQRPAAAVHRAGLRDGDVFAA